MKLSDYIKVISGGTPKTSINKYWNGNIPWISIKDFNNSNRYINCTEKSITEEGLKNSTTNLLINDDIIISARGTVGCLAQIKNPMAFNQSCYGIRSSSNLLLQNYLYYWLIANIKQFMKNTHGAVFDTITRNTFDSIDINFPDTNHQQHIVDIIGSIDDKIENNNKIINNLDNLGRLRYSYLEKKFENINKYVDFIKGKEASSSNYISTKLENTINFIRVKDLNEQTNTFISKDLKIPFAFDNDLLISFDGAVGRTNFGLCGAYSSGICKVQTKNNNDYGIYYWALTDDINQNIMKKHTNGTTILHGGKSIPFLIIKKHNTHLSEVFNKYYDLMLAYKRENKKLNVLKQSYLKKFFG